MPKPKLAEEAQFHLTDRKSQPQKPQVLDRKMQMLRLYTHQTEFPIMMRPMLREIQDISGFHSPEEGAVLIICVYARARLDHGIAGSVFQKQELVNISNCQQASWDMEPA